MLARTILDDVRRELLEFGAQNFWSDTELLRHLNRAQYDFVNRTRYLEDSATLSLTQGRADYPLPANWLSARLVMLQVPKTDQNDEWYRLTAATLEKAAQENVTFLDNEEERQGRPLKYYIWGNNLYLRKAPNADYAGTLHLFYKSKPNTITDADSEHIEIDETLSEALNAYILWKAWAKEKELDLALEQKNNYLSYVAEGRRWVKKKHEAVRFDINSSQSISMNSGNWPL